MLHLEPAGASGVESVAIKTNHGPEFGGRGSVRTRAGPARIADRGQRIVRSKRARALLVSRMAGYGSLVDPIQAQEDNDDAAVNPSAHHDESRRVYSCF